MAVIRRDNGAASGTSGASIGMLCLGIIALGIASSLCVALYIQLQKQRALRLQMIAEEKLTKIGKPVLQHAPEQVVNTSLDLARMTKEMRENLAQRQFKPLPPSQAYKNHAAQWNLPQSSSGSSGSISSGPIPTSSSEGTNASQAKSSNAESTTYHSIVNSQAHNVTPQRPRRSAAESPLPFFARENRVTRVAVPSALLRGLGDLPQLPAPGSGAVSLSPRPQAPPKDETSQTPVISADLESNMAQAISSDDLQGEVAHEGERSMWLHRALSNVLDKKSTQSKAKDLESQLLARPTNQKPVTAGPSPVTVDYFSLTSRRNLVPAQVQSTKEVKANPVKHSNNPSQSKESPYKRPSMVLPPLPTETKKQSSNSSKDEVSEFRPLSLGLSLKSSSKSSMLHAATMFGDLPGSFWTETPSLSLNRISTKKLGDESLGASSSNESSLQSAIFERRDSDTSAAATSIDVMSNDAYDGASFAQSFSKELPAVEEPRVLQIEPTFDIPALGYTGSVAMAPFMTPHHRAVYPDQLDEEDEEWRNSRALTPDLSQIHSAPLPPAGFPLSSAAPTKSSFASTFRAKAKMTLSRGRTSSIPTPAIPVAQRQMLDPSTLASPANHLRPNSFTSSCKSPAETIVAAWKASSEGQPSPNVDVTPTLGLGLSDETGKAMDHQMTTSSSIGHGGSDLFQSPTLDESEPWSELKGNGMQEVNQASSKVSQYSESHSPAARHVIASQHRSPGLSETLGTPPVRQVESPQFGILSTLSPQYGQTAAMIGSNWSLNRQPNHAHKASIASSTCDTISTCMTDASESVSMYDEGKAQDQRSKLLQTIQQSKSTTKAEAPGSSKVEQRSFYSHTARVSMDSNCTETRSATPVPTAGQSSSSTVQTSPSTKKPTHLTLDIKAGARQSSQLPNTAPLTPPLTPNEQQTSVSPLLDSAVPLQEKATTLEQQNAAKLAKLRPLSLAVSQHSASSSIPRFMAATGASSWHRSQYSQHSVSSNTSTLTGGPSTSSSNASLFQSHTNSPGRLSLLTSTSPSRANFKSLSYRGGAQPVGVLPTLPADASPSFLTSTSTPRIVAASSPLSTPNWDMATPSPRFSRASINTASMIPYHSPLSIDAFSTPRRQPTVTPL